jgi:tetratricopeptide (TPR) repeat protein
MRSFLLAFALTLVCCGGAFAGPKEDCDQDKDDDLIIRGCTQIIEGRVRNYSRDTAYNNRCLALNNKGSYDLAIADCDEAIRINPRDVAAYNNRCLARNNKREYDQAIPDCEQAIRLDPKYHYAYANLGYSYQFKKDYDRSIWAYSQSIRLHPKYAIAYNNRGDVYYSKGDYDSAIADYNQAILFDPSLNTYSNRGDAHYAKGDFDRALADYEQSVRLRPKAPKSYYDRGDVYYRKGDCDRAIPDFDQALRLNPQYNAAWHSRSLCHSYKGDYDRAIADAEQEIRIKPSLDAYNQRGVSYYFKGEYDRAIADYEQALRMGQKSAAVQNNLCSAYLAKEQYERSIPYCNEAIAIDANYPNPLSHRGWAFYKLGNYERAAADLKEAVRINPKYLGARERRGHVLLALGNASAALEDFNEVLRVNAGSVASYWGRGQAYEKTGLRSLALGDYKKAIELRANGPVDAEAQNSARARLIALETGSSAPVAAAPQVPPSTAATAQAKPKIVMGRRVALVIGNGAYRAVSALPNPRNDAKTVAAELARAGFEVLERYDLGVDGMRSALGSFEDMVTGSDWAFVYYAGHGMELNGKNWLIPVDARLARSSDMPDEAIPLDRVLDRLSAAKKLRIVVLDACRNNPFTSRMVLNRVSTRAVTRGLAGVEPTHGEVVFYAARDGNVALDGTGSNSPFTSAMVKHMQEEGIELGRFFRRVTSTVMEATGNQQEPFVYGRLPDEDYFIRPPR